MDERRSHSTESNEYRSAATGLADLRARRFLASIRRRFGRIVGGGWSDCILWGSGARLARSRALRAASRRDVRRNYSRRLWRRLPVDVLVVPLAILAATYALVLSGQWVLLTSIAMYAAVWHRGRQSLGIARFYQHQAGGPLSPLHRRLFVGAIYLPMAASIFLYGHLAPEKYEGERYYALGIGADVSWGLGLIAAAWVVAYLVWTWGQTEQGSQSNFGQAQKIQTLHPAERWVVLAHAVAFGSAYVLGATNASFLLVLVVHHEVQYLYFAYAMARRQGLAGNGENSLGNLQSELRIAASFALWPFIGLSGALGAVWYQLEWLAPLGAGGLFCHYWLDGRIWTRRALGR
jgi:hypothetical protein